MCLKSSFTIPAVAAISFCLIGGTVPAPVYADLGDQLFKLLSKDGVKGDTFGFSVAISGNVAIIGAHGDDDNGNFSGSAYLFDTTTGQQLFKLLPDDGAELDLFGASVGISGNIAIVGAYWDDDNGDKSGSAYLFDVTTGLQIAKLLPDDGAAGDHFGWAVAISGPSGKEVAIVGARKHNDNGNASGSAYLFDATTGQQLFKLLADDGAELDFFGVSVAISGATAIVGAWGDDDNASAAGAAYLFDTNTGLQIGKLLADDGDVSDFFGKSVAISSTLGNETAIVGAWADDDHGETTGSAYLFDIGDPKNPIQIAKLVLDDGAAYDQFGHTVAIKGATAIVGARGHDDNGNNSGSAYLYDANTGTLIAQLLPNDGAAWDNFGFSVAISGVNAIVGARWDDDNGDNSGSAYLFVAGDPKQCPWDLDGNEVVGVPDLLSLLASWGPCKGCPADFDGNGNVGVSDLLALLANWGPCP